MSLRMRGALAIIAFVRHVRNQKLLNWIGNRIKEIREDAGITQEQFYHDTGIHLGRIEAAQTNLTISSLQAICQYFKVSLERFFEGA
jgi:DNA-binding XRE family transcriptional regulator